MNITIRRSLFLSFLTILAVGMGAAGWLAWQSVERLYRETLSENLLAQANLTALALDGQPLPPDSFQVYSQTTNTAPGIHTRLLSEQGAVLVSLPVLSDPIAPPSAENSTAVSAENLVMRPEIASAMRGQSASAVRKIEDRLVLYAAAPVRGANGELTGLVYLATPLPRTGLPVSVIVQLAAGGAGATALALLTGSLIARSISRRIEEIAAAAQAVRQGDLAREVSGRSGIVELDGLAQVFNQMTASLRKAEQAKNAFVADVTHELRTPLTVIKGTIETLEDGAMDDLEARSGLISAMGRETERLIRLVNHLLVLARADAGTLQLTLSRFDLVNLVRERCKMYAALADGKQVLFEFAGPGDAWVRADSDRCAQVIDNILDNAMRYSPAGTSIRFHFTRTNDTCECAITDGGPGIAAQHLPLIFERFYRAEPSRNRQSGGAGLGLAIARSLVLAQGGQISASSEAGQGATIRFSLPAAP